MPKIGDVELGKAIGKLSLYNSYIWHACAKCGKERWVRLIRGKPKSLVCIDCSPRCYKRGFYYTDGYVTFQENGKTIFRARRVLEQKLGRPLKPNHLAHHINEIRDDDSPENLMEVSRNEHAKMHAQRAKSKLLGEKK